MFSSLAAMNSHPYLVRICKLSDLEVTNWLGFCVCVFDRALTEVFLKEWARAWNVEVFALQSVIVLLTSCLFTVCADLRQGLQGCSGLDEGEP